MDQLQAIRAFARVVEAGNFTRAADSLEMPNATLSKLVQELEAHLGVRLLQRTTRRVTVTPEGRDYYDKTARILRDLEDIDTSFNSVRSHPRGQLRIDVGGSTASDVLIPALPEFMARYPDIRIDLGVSDRPVDLISDNVDCVIRGGPLDNSSLIARQIGAATLLTCATPAYLKAFGTPAYPDELKNGHRLVSYLSPQTGRAFPLRFERDGEKCEIKVDHRIGVNESNAHLAAGLAGLGIIQTFSYALESALKSGALVEILRPWRPAPYPFHVVYPQNRHVTHRLRVFIDWLLESFPKNVNR
ncbi:LysR family transcriptional regulator [Kosakonia radicincitans]|uniref:DNA-binding transcriptional regulator, LysR family n=1 Tax=Kosakonia radicincitans TaxID=283686 RepID=A0AAX2ELZ1_9ENTR|nr:LysR family transcriptional regulator [Kosakonia radicincitans]MDP9564951.1 DNA-binding transcriptional LysR family regulator [Kosakonia oryzae]APG17056.1 LysR family transcriptional regulator [Kosakonia radicincitans]KDE33755.1 LysR family transcriptional regulator [Kosakonia radicincitans UMEnt01/12]QEM92669.1 LysR family transcriptional regulator [Kosakonia radicincitans]SFD92901.1 DNA-binding transcriptional regulator, LysR family [Kosakonia radicincitans]